MDKCGVKFIKINEKGKSPTKTGRVCKFKCPWNKKTKCGAQMRWVKTRSAAGITIKVQHSSKRPHNSHTEEWIDNYFIKNGHDKEKRNRCDTQPGIPLTNNGLERNNRTEKQSDGYKIRAPQQFLPAQLDWVQSQSWARKQFGTTFSSKVWNTKEMSKALQLLEDGYDKLTWKMGSKEVVISEEEFIKLDPSHPVKERKKALQDWMDTFRGIAKDPENKTDGNGFEEVKSWVYGFFFLEQMEPGPLHDACAQIFRKAADPDELECGDYSFKLYKCSCPRWQQYLLCKHALCFGIARHCFPWPMTRDPRKINGTSSPSDLTPSQGKRGSAWEK